LLFELFTAVIRFIIPALRFLGVAIRAALTIFGGEVNVAFLKTIAII
jgi:hypothetical protein